eukprot:gene17055-19440_t
MLLASNGRLGFCRKFVSQHRSFASLHETLKLNVGGQKYTLFRDDIQKYPGSFFATAIKERPFSNKEFLSINRNGVLFKYINVFLVSGGLPRNASGQINVDQKTLKLLKKEAEFYKLNALKAECESKVTDAKVVNVKPRKEIPVTPVESSAPVVNTLSELWRPIVKLAEVKCYSHAKLFRECSISDVDAMDLISAAKKIAPSQSGPYTVDAFLLSQSALKQIEEAIDVTDLFPNQLVTLRARELKSLIVKHGEMGYDSYRYDAKLMDDVKVRDFDMPRLVQVAQHLQSQHTDSSSSSLRMDPYFLDSATLTDLTINADLTELFPDKQLDFRVKEVLIHDTSSHFDLCASPGQEETAGKGYLGTLVMVLGSYFKGGSVRLSRAAERPTILTCERMSWYAYAAGTTHHLHPISHGTRVAVYYDVYSAGDVGKVHDPLEGAVLATVSGTTTTDTVRDQVLTVVKDELTNAEAVVITLQDVYPDKAQSDALTGGDCALYDTFTNAADGFADVQLVTVNLQYEYDYSQRKQVLKKSSVRNTFGDCSDSPASGIKLVIPTKLAKRHRITTDKMKGFSDAYTVTGVRVSKAKKG